MSNEPSERDIGELIKGLNNLAHSMRPSTVERVGHRDRWQVRARKSWQYAQSYYRPALIDAYGVSGHGQDLGTLGGAAIDAMRAAARAEGLDPKLINDACKSTGFSDLESTATNSGSPRNILISRRWRHPRGWDAYINGDL